MAINEAYCKFIGRIIRDEFERDNSAFLDLFYDL